MEKYFPILISANAESKTLAKSTESRPMLVAGNGRE
jgi:hypothetical protein